MRAGWLILDLVSAVILGLGVLALVSPFALYRWIHGSYDRYVWIIQGPYPYSYLASGPFQMAVGMTLLVAAGWLLVAGGALRWWLRPAGVTLR